MSTAGFNSQNGTGQAYANGPSQNPVAPHQLPGIGYGSTPQPTYDPMQAKAAPPPGPPGPYPVCSYRPGAPFVSYPPPSGQSMLTRPMMGGPPSHTPPQSASPGPRPPPAQATPPPAVSSSSYYTNPQQAPAWQYNTAPPPTGAPTSISTPPRGLAPP
uniref:Uncharacterized protein n=2 Tax=Gasterosteus aculeatus TaxID=69293 RepID=G3N9B6_GASAC